MLTKTEFRILELMFDDLTQEYSIMKLARALKLPYPQIHRTVKSLLEKKLVSGVQKGKALMIKLELKKINQEYINIELMRGKKIFKKYKNLEVLSEDLEKIIPVQFMCIVFGSYAKKKAKKTSDIDLLFVIPEEYDYRNFEKKVKNSLTVPRVDVNITTEQGLLEMWQKPAQLNVGNELLKAHVVLRGAEAFLYLRRKYYIG